MRIIILSLLLIINIIFIFHDITQALTVSFLSIRIILAFLSFVLSIFLLLLHVNRYITILTIVTLLVSIIHIALIAHSVYLYIY